LVEAMLQRSMLISYETVRRWALKLGPAYARRLRRNAPSRHNIWPLDEVMVTIARQKHWLWRAVDQDGSMLDEVSNPVATPRWPSACCSVCSRSKAVRVGN
jgi:putative transposase